ncbi:DUF4865 family protein [Franconibacter pulveris]
MIVMQYRFTLPADYDMAKIAQRIADNGAKLDGFPGLIFKTYLWSRRDDAALASRENRYAPLYCWRDADSMARFLKSPGFAALTRQFGWPHIDSWLARRLPDVAEVKAAKVIALRSEPVAPFSEFALPQAMLAAWDVSRWSWLRADFLAAPPAVPQPGYDYYRTGYVACG